MLGKKGISPFIAFVLVVAISIAGMVLVLRIGRPLLEKTEDFSKLSEAKDTMNQINSAIKEVSYEGNGSSRKLSVMISGGEYRVSDSSNSITYEMESKHELFSPGLSKKEGDMYVEFYSNYTLKLILNSTNVNITNNERWARGHYSLVIKNEGYSGDKNNIRINVV